MNHASLLNLWVCTMRMDGLPALNHEFDLCPPFSIRTPSMSLTACRRSIRTWCGYVAVAAVGLGALPIQADEPASRAAAVSSKSVGQQLSEAEQLAYVREKVVPLLQARCGECHGGGPVNKGGLTLTSRESILKGGIADRPWYPSMRIRVC